MIEILGLLLAGVLFGCIIALFKSLGHIQQHTQRQTAILTAAVRILAKSAKAGGASTDEINKILEDLNKEL